MATKLELSGKCEHKFKEVIGRINGKYRECVYRCIFCKKTQKKYYLLNN